MKTEQACQCPRCGDRSAPKRAPFALRALVPLAWVPILLFGACLAILLPLNLVLIPCWIAVGSSLGALAREVLDPKCAACGATRGESTPAAASFARRSFRPADEGATKGRLVGEA